MKISEYINKAKTEMKEKSPKERVGYFWDYYKWHVIIGLVVLAFLIHTLVGVFTAKETMLRGLLIDGVEPVEQPAVLQGFYDANGLDPQKQEVELITGLSLSSSMPQVNAVAYQRLHAGIGAGDTDFIMGYEYALMECGYDTSHMLMDLRELLPKETLEKLKDRLFYIDESLLDVIKDSKGEDIPLPPPNQPDKMKDPVPVAVDISGFQDFVTAYYAKDTPLYLAVAVNAPHPQLMREFILFCFPETSGSK